MIKGQQYHWCIRPVAATLLVFSLSFALISDGSERAMAQSQLPQSPQAPAVGSGRTFDQRKAAYAPWSPAQMVERRKEYGLIGPGTTKPVPAPAFPSYLKKPDSIEQLMPQARAAVRQTGGRTPLGLVEPGNHANTGVSVRVGGGALLMPPSYPLGDFWTESGTLLMEILLFSLSDTHHDHCAFQVSLKLRQRASKNG